MTKKEILNFCIEKNILLDNDLLELFSSSENAESVKNLIEGIKNITSKNFITKDVLSSNKESVKRVFLENLDNKQILKDLTIKLGINLEISANSSEKKEQILDLSEEPKVKVLSSFNNIEKAFDVKDFVKYFRSRFDFLKKILENHSSLKKLVSINKLNNSNQNISLIGFVLNKSVTKNKNIILEVEDFTGKIKVLINKDKQELYEIAENICLDSVLGFKGSGNKDILFANEIVFPEASLSVRKKAFLEEYALFISDLHFGSKNFMKNDFLKFIDYLNLKVPGTEEEVKKIKYLFIVGDIVTGVGNYPDQERDLEIKDLEKQFSSLAELLGKIRKDIKIIISPGNHDGVRLMEPQPVFDEKYAWALHDLDNVILVENPSLVNIAARANFEGFNVLVYHGFSFPYYANNVFELMKQKAMDSPEIIMQYLLKYRHLAPTHGSVQYYPAEKDPLLIRKIPDIFVAGHTHKSGVSYFNNILLVSSSSWEDVTPYQEKFGNVPDHCKVPMINLKTRAVKILDFETPKDQRRAEDE